MGYWYICNVEQAAVVQNKALCILTNSPCNTHSPSIFIKLGILTVFSINNLQTACFIYKAMNKIVPSFFVNMFAINCAIHNYNTRQENNLHVTSYSTKVREHSVSVSGVNMWNNIPEEFKELKTYNQFRLKLKRYPCQHNHNWIVFTKKCSCYIYIYIYI